MSRYKITIQYDGLSFSGFQSQKNLNTIQDKIEHSLCFLNKNNLIKNKGCRANRCWGTCFRSSSSL